MSGSLRTFARALFVTGALALVLLPVSAQAETIRFDQFQQGGTLTSAGVGTNIIFEYITYDANDDGNIDDIAYCGSTFTLPTGTNTNCYLNFDTSTGSFVLSTDPNAGLYSSTFSLITGTLSSVVLSGTFTTAGFDGTGLNFTATGYDTKNQALLDYFGVLATNFTFNNTEILVDSRGGIDNADIVNTPAVPEPGLLALFGLGLLGVGRKLARRRV
jgi:hypothetical protein